MTPQARFRRIGWLVVLGICLALYTLLHLRVNAVHADVVRAEREIVALENQNLLLETEFLTRSSQVQLAAWNRVDFGFVAPRADQFIDSPVELASFGSPRGADAPAPIMLAGMTSLDEMPEFPQLVSPLTGEPVDEAVLAGAAPEGSHLAVAAQPGPLRVPIAGARQVAVAAVAGAAAR